MTDTRNIKNGATDRQSLMFPQTITDKYKVIKSSIGPGEHDYRVPLRDYLSFAYIHGPGVAAIYLVRMKGIEARVKRLETQFPFIERKQLGFAEATFTVPFDQLEAVLSELGAVKRRIISESDKKRRTENLKRGRPKQEPNNPSVATGTSTPQIDSDSKDGVERPKRPFQTASHGRRAQN